MYKICGYLKFEAEHKWTLLNTDGLPRVNNYEEALELFKDFPFYLITLIKESE